MRGRGVRGGAVCHCLPHSGPGGCWLQPCLVQFQHKLSSKQDGAVFSYLRSSTSLTTFQQTQTVDVILCADKCCCVQRQGSQAPLLLVEPGIPAVLGGGIDAAGILAWQMNPGERACVAAPVCWLHEVKEGSPRQLRGCHQAQ